MELTKTHALKTWPEYYWPVVDGVKPFEIRKNDRDYKVGEYLQLNEYDPNADEYSGQSALFTITYITDFAQQPGYVVMGIKPVRIIQTAPQTMEGILGEAQEVIE